MNVYDTASTRSSKTENMPASYLTTISLLTSRSVRQLDLEAAGCCRTRR